MDYKNILEKLTDRIVKDYVIDKKRLEKYNDLLTPEDMSLLTAKYATKGRAHAYRSILDLISEMVEDEGILLKINISTDKEQVL